jgi:dipeptidyl-peptidase-4
VNPKSILIATVALFAMCILTFADEGVPRETRNIEGWSVRIHRKLLEQDAAATARALELLTVQLREIKHTVPAAAVAHLQKVPLWISPEYPGVQPRAEYHPNAGWLRDHGRDPAMAKGVEFTNVRIFEREVSRMPCFVLHELAHSFHDQVLGFENPEIEATYQHAKASGSYDHVERHNGEGRPNTFNRAYAMTNAKEYFAENSEAFFGTNDFFPFNRDELAKHDPEMFRLLDRLWNSPGSTAVRQR